MAEINQWVMHASELNSDITATRSLWDTLICTREHGTDCKHLIRLPLSQHKLEMGTFTSVGFSNLEDAPPMNDETERTLVQCLVGESNDLFSVRVSAPTQWLIDFWTKTFSAVSLHLSSS
jgi:hypothetical protein